MTLLWAGVSIILAINSMWLLKLNKELVERNEELIARNIVNSLENKDIEITIKPLTDKQREMIDRWLNDNKED